MELICVQNFNLGHFSKVKNFFGPAGGATDVFVVKERNFVFRKVVNFGP